MSAPEPIATGTLAKTALPHLLVYLEQKKLSGTLAVWPDDAEPTGNKKPDRVLMLKGVPVAGSLCAPAASLREGLLQLFLRARAPYAFYGANLLGDDRLSARVDPFSLIAESLRGDARDDVVRDVVQRLGNAKLTLPAELDLARYELQAEELALIATLRGKPSSAEQIVSQMAVASGLSPVRGLRLVYLLTITKAIETVAAPAAPESVPSAPVRPPVPPTPPPLGRRSSSSQTQAVASATPLPAHAAVIAEEEPSHEPEAQPISGVPSDGEAPLHSSLDRLQSIPPPPEALDDELRQRWLRIVTKGRLIENQNFFEMLDLEKDVKSSEARAKYFQVAKEWHPDRLPSELTPLREYVQIIFSYMSEANTTLGDDMQRAKYLQTVREGGGTPATERLMQAILDTAMEYERVLVLARRHQYDDAIALLLKILSVVKEDAEYHAMYASLLNQKYGPQATDGEQQQILESVDKALQLYDRHEKANLLKAQILRKMGRQSEALTFFKKVAEINPRNIDAMREVRVATMRSADSKSKRSPEERKNSGLFGKLFKKE